MEREPSKVVAPPAPVAVLKLPTPSTQKAFSLQVTLRLSSLWFGHYVFSVKMYCTFRTTLIYSFSPQIIPVCIPRLISHKLYGFALGLYFYFFAKFLLLFCQLRSSLFSACLFFVFFFFLVFFHCVATHFVAFSFLSPHLRGSNSYVSSSLFVCLFCLYVLINSHQHFRKPSLASSLDTYCFSFFS